MIILLIEQLLVGLLVDIKKFGYVCVECIRGIVYIGLGVFYCVYQVVYIDMVMVYGGNWWIMGVLMCSVILKCKLVEQDNLYLLVVLDNEFYVQVIGVFDEVLVLDEDCDVILVVLIDVNIYIIFLIIIEKGYCLISSGELDMLYFDIINDLVNLDQLVLVVGLIVCVFKECYESGVVDMIVISCDNLVDNGKKLEKVVY